MNKVTIYTVLTYLLMPFGFILALNTLTSLPVSIANPSLLILTFLIGCSPVYVFCTSVFLFKGLRGGRVCSKRLQEWIKANAYVSFFFIVILSLSAITLLSFLKNPVNTEELIKQLQNNPNPLFKSLSPIQLLEILKKVMYVVLPFCGIFLVHIVLTFQLIKANTHLFSKE
jgi:hypothetical protein